eukprot:TRINITY_DN2335_c0_g1_i1.p1 TRINITY_DN2335_c0_g1~~TRINITY_DN2335_c0_g1_i1.p1  ORF type:complete len:530 (-),score=114.31 TRINITY_DN2335_c0_g1_i1:52-1641(-)
MDWETVEMPLELTHKWGTLYFIVAWFVLCFAFAAVVKVWRWTRRCSPVVALLPGAVAVVLFVVLVFVGLFFVGRVWYSPVLKDTWSLGMVSHQAAKLWFHSIGNKSIYVTYSTAIDPSKVYKTEKHILSTENYWISTVKLDNLQAGTEYLWQVFSYFEENQTEVSLNGWMGKFKTFPSPNQPTHLLFNFGSCMEKSYLYDIKIFKFWEETLRPHLLLFLGDTIYTDVFGDVPHLQLYQQILSDPYLTSLLHAIPSFWMYDDHEIYNDYDSGPEHPFYALSMRYWSLFIGARNPEAPGRGEEVYYSFEYGNVGFFVLDIRMYRSANWSPDDGRKSMLGEKQKGALLGWLKEGAKEKVFKFIVSPVPWSSVIHFVDGWRSFLHEREEIFNFIKENGISGVVLLSADIHYPLLTNISGGWLKEYSVSPISSFPLFPEESEIEEHFPSTVNDELLYVTSLDESYYAFYFGSMEVNTSENDGDYTFKLYGYNLWNYEAEVIYTIKQSLKDTIPFDSPPHPRSPFHRKDKHHKDL